jgi:hypothetical protein
VRTLVRLVSDDGSDTGGLRLIGDAVSLEKFTQGPEQYRDLPQDFGRLPKLYTNRLTISQSSNWYIDTPTATSALVSARFFQMHVIAVDAAGTPIPGVEAWYGFDFFVNPDPTNFAKSTVDWGIWEQQTGAQFVDSTDHFEGDPHEAIEERYT